MLKFPVFQMGGKTVDMSDCSASDKECLTAFFIKTPETQTLSLPLMSVPAEIPVLTQQISGCSVISEADNPPDHDDDSGFGEGESEPLSPTESQMSFSIASVELEKKTLDLDIDLMHMELDRALRDKKTADARGILHKAIETVVNSGQTIWPEQMHLMAARVVQAEGDHNLTLRLLERVRPCPESECCRGFSLIHQRYFQDA
ncbi:hypothetical protein [Parendozoicomonas haliclonae]|uniref:Uncharacterized protein n=1 Tax=Parendozoicomonas haliclonae TaxID=1960125 RepID=A0A1X7APE8_9GAMM|nr:hypothetical protein [Parendozoicomonas haliclonae]SMA50023.1 hypothetical protein EHSB41UT_03814 [Parendozoicomonas haliclonae]